jgi:uncharacterized protein YkwD
VRASVPCSCNDPFILALASSPRSRALCVAFIATAITSVLMVPATANARIRACADASLEPTANDQHALAVATLCLVNRIRAGFHLRALRPNPALAHLASHEARQLVAEDYFADESPSGQTPSAMIAGSPYPRRSRGYQFGQNLAWGTESGASPGSIVAAWMASPPHRAIMLDGSYRDVGVAALAAVPTVKSWHPGGTYAMEFGTRHRH